MVPTNQIIELKAGRRCDVHCVRLAAFGQDAGRNVAEGERLHRFTDRINGVVTSSDVALNLIGVSRDSVPYLSKHNVGDDARPTNTIKKAE